jgi:hypothetical protein
MRTQLHPVRLALGIPSLRGLQGQRKLLEDPDDGKNPHDISSQLSKIEQTNDWGQAMLDSMQSPTKTELSTERVLRAEAELLAYVQSGSCNLQQQKQLAMVVRFAIDESIGQLAKPWPTRWKFPPAFRPTHI